MKPTGPTTTLAVFLVAAAAASGASLSSALVPADISSAPRFAPAVFRPSDSVVIRPTASARIIATQLRSGAKLNRFVSPRSTTVAAPVVTLSPPVARAVLTRAP